MLGRACLQILGREAGGRKLARRKTRAERFVRKELQKGLKDMCRDACTAKSARERLARTHKFELAQSSLREEIEACAETLLAGSVACLPACLLASALACLSNYGSPQNGPWVPPLVALKEASQCFSHGAHDFPSFEHSCEMPWGSERTGAALGKWLPEGALRWVLTDQMCWVPDYFRTGRNQLGYFFLFLKVALYWMALLLL